MLEFLLEKLIHGIVPITRGISIINFLAPGIWIYTCVTTKNRRGIDRIKPQWIDVPRNYYTANAAGCLKTRSFLIRYVEQILWQLSLLFDHFLLSTPFLNDVRKNTEQVHRSNYAFDCPTFPFLTRMTRRSHSVGNIFPLISSAGIQLENVSEEAAAYFPHHSYPSVSESPQYLHSLLYIYWYLLLFPNSRCKSCSVRKFSHQINAIFKSCTGVPYLQWEWILTANEYSTRIIQQSRIEGDTGGIFRVFPFQVSVLPEAIWFPRTLATIWRKLFVFPLAR